MQESQTVMSQLNISRKRFIIRPDIFRETQQRNRTVVVTTELFGRSDTLAIVKDIQPTDQCFSLSLIILHTKQLDSGTGRSTQERFDLIFIHDLVECARCRNKCFVLLFNLILTCLLAELLEVARFQYTLIFLYLTPTGIDRPLSDLMR